MTSVVGLTEILNVTVTPSESGTVITGGGSGSGVILPSVDTLGYNSISVQLTGAWETEITFQASNDNVNWVNVQGYAFNSTMVAIDTAVDNDIYMLPVIGRYFQIVSTGYQGGTVYITAYLRTQSLAGLGEAALSQAMDSTTGTPLNVTFEGVQGPGQQPAANSVPVALANEQVLDKWIAGKQWTGAIPVNTNLLLGPEIATTGDYGAPLDVLQYRSMSFQCIMSSTVTGTVILEASNDGVSWTPWQFFENGNVTLTPGGAQTTFSFATSSSTSRWCITSLLLRYIRLRINGAISTAGVNIQITTRLSMTPYTNPQVGANIIYQASTAIPGGVTNFNSVNQTVSTTGGQLSGAMAPLIVGGSDRSIVRQEMIGAPINPAVTAYNLNGPWARQMAVDGIGNVGVSGPPGWLAEEKTTPVNVRLERTTNSQDSVQDLLQQILVEIKALSYYTRELPTSIALAVSQGNPLIADLGGMSDDPENFYNDPTTFRYTKGN